MSGNKKYIVIGSGKLTVQIAEYLKSENLSPVVFEKQIAEASSVRRMCEKKEIPYEAMDSKKMTERLLKELSEHRIFVFSSINTYIFPKKVIEHENFQGINYHNALLPYHKGMNAEAWSIYDMDSVTGITWHRIRPAIDEGEILIQKKIKLDENITSLKLLKKQSDLAYEAFLEIIPSLLSDEKIKFVNQANVENASMHKIKDVPNDGYLSKKWDFHKTFAFLRAMDYGKLNTLRKPHIRFRSDVYEWDKYKIEKGTEAEQDSVEINANNIIISKKGVADRIILVNSYVPEKSAT
ncbi:MAG: hypothetical protein J6I55_05625 [Ruminococcus sp.]|nr:hypothetical protein [Ruminococcus sp.]